MGDIYLERAESGTDNFLLTYSAGNSGEITEIDRLPILKGNKQKGECSFVSKGQKCPTNPTSCNHTQ